MSLKILLYRIKADSPEFACEKAEELVIPKVDLGLLNEEEIVLAQVLTILNKLYNKYNSSLKLENLNYLDVLEGENLEVLKQNLEDIKSKTLADNLNWTLDHDWRNNKFLFPGLFENIKFVHRKYWIEKYILYYFQSFFQVFCKSVQR